MFGLDDALKHCGFEETRSSVGCDMSDEGPKGGELGEDHCCATKLCRGRLSAARLETTSC